MYILEDELELEDYDEREEDSYNVSNGAQITLLNPETYEVYGPLMEETLEKSKATFSYRRRKLDTFDALDKSLEWSDLFGVLKYKKDFKENHPDYFKPDGIILFDGPQGSGKTLSATRYVSFLLRSYPKARVCSNVNLPEFEKEERFIFFDNANKLLEERNGEYGMIFFIDEIHILFNSLESKDIDLSLFTAICQQRKQRVHIVGTSQLFNRVAKPFREQVKYAVMCNCILGVFQFNKIVKGEDMEIDENGNVKTKKIRHSWFFHSPALYKSYDTLAVIDNVEFDFGNTKKKNRKERR